MQTILTIIIGSQVSLQPVPQDPDKSGSSAHLSGDKLKSHNFTFDHAYWSHDPGDANFITQDRVFTGSDETQTNVMWDLHNVRKVIITLGLIVFKQCNQTSPILDLIGLGDLGLDC